MSCFLRQLNSILIIISHYHKHLPPPTITCPFTLSLFLFFSCLYLQSYCFCLQNYSYCLWKELDLSNGSFQLARLRSTIRLFSFIESPVRDPQLQFFGILQAINFILGSGFLGVMSYVQQYLLLPSTFAVLSSICPIEWDLYPPQARAKIHIYIYIYATKD